MDNTEDYKKLIAEIVKKQMDILGPEIAVGKASNIPGLKISESGEVVEVLGDPQSVLQKLVDSYILLSGEIVRNILDPVFAKYPAIKLKIQ